VAQLERGQRMTRPLTLCFALVFMASACADRSPPVPLAKKEELRKILAPTFDLTSVPPGQEEDFYRVLEAFAETRRPDEFVYRIDIGSDAGVWFRNSGMHGGAASVKKKWGAWVIDQKFYNM
jgi:hypothetical protein